MRALVFSHKLDDSTDLVHGAVTLAATGGQGCYLYRYLIIHGRAMDGPYLCNTLHKDDDTLMICQSTDDAGVAHLCLDDALS